MKNHPILVTKEKVRVVKAYLFWEIYQRFLAKEMAREIIKAERRKSKVESCN